MVIDAEQEKKEIINRYRRLLRKAKPILKEGDAKLIKKAFTISLEAHKDMRRKSGEPFIFHPLSVAEICTEEIGLGTTSIIAALMHDVVEDTDIELADIEDKKMRMLYKESDGVVLMDEKTFDQLTVSFSIIGDKAQWLKEEVEYDIIFYKGEVIDFNPPTFMELVVTETSVGLRGDTSGRVLKPAMTDTGAKIQVPIFIEEGEKIKKKKKEKVEK